MSKTRVAVWAALVGLSACAPIRYRTADSPSSAAHDDDDDHDDAALPTSAAAAGVRVMQNPQIDCESEALGTVDVHEAMQNEDAALDLLRRRAAALGATAVVGVEFHHGEGSGEPTHLSGMAVRCNDLIRGRRYEVLGDVEVEGAMGHEKAAFEALRARGAAMHADLLVGVHFEHGEGGAPTRVTAKAIRFVKDAP